MGIFFFFGGGKDDTLFCESSVFILDEFESILLVPPSENICKCSFIISELHNWLPIMNSPSPFLKGLRDKSMILYLF